MSDPMRDFDLDDALSNSRIMPDPEFKNALQQRLQSIRKTAPFGTSNGWRRPLSILFEPTQQRPKGDSTMSNTRLTMIFGLGITLVLVMVFGSAILMPDGPIAGLFAPKETGEFLADDLSDITGVWAYPGTAGNEHIYMQFNSDGSGRRDFYVEQRDTGWLVRQDPAVGDGNLGTGEFRAWFEDGHLYLQEIAWRGTQVPKDDPIGVYDAYVTKEEGVPVSLKLIVIEDKQAMRRSYMNQMIADWVGLPASAE